MLTTHISEANVFECNIFSGALNKSMAEDSVFLSDENVPADPPSSPTADEIIAGGESKSKLLADREDEGTGKQPERTICLSTTSIVSVEPKPSSEGGKDKHCKEDEDDKLKQNESGTLLSRGGEFEAEPHQTDNVLNDIQTNSDIRFFICGSCKYNPILIGSVPKLLPCLHSFCENCLQDRYDKQKEAADDPSTENTPRLKCPSCGQEFLVAANDKPTSAFLNNQFVIESTPAEGIKNSKPEEEHQCTSCDDRSIASSYCLNCNEWLCDACVNAHQRVKVTKDHIIQARSSCNNDSPVTEIQADADAKRKPLYCKVHPQEQLKLFCANCEKLTCRDCQLIEHKDHRYQFIDEAASKHREILKKLLQYLQINLGLLKETIGDVEKVYDGLTLQEQDLEGQVNRAFNGLINAIKTRQESIIKELKSLVISKQMLLSKQKKDLTQMKVILEHNHDFAEFAVKGGSNVALLYSRKVLGTRLHNLNSLKYRQRPLAALDLKFSMDVEKLRSYFGKIGTVYSHEDMQRKIDHYNSKAGGNANPARTMALTSRVIPGKNITSSKNPIESMTAINKRISEHQATQSNTPTQYINLSKQGTLGLPGHQMVRTPVSTSAYNNSGSYHKRYDTTPTTSAQEMIVLSSSHSEKVAAMVKDVKMMPKDGRYNTHYPNQRESLTRRSPKTPYEHKSFQFQHHTSQSNRDGRASLSSPITESAIHWPKVTDHHIGPKHSNNMDQLRKMVEGASTHRNKTENNNMERSASTRSNGSEGSSHSGQLSLGGIIVKQEGHSPDSQQLPGLHIKTAFRLSHSTAQQKTSTNSHDEMRSESGFDEGQNEDYCGVCRNGGELLCCDTCPKVYHLHCHIPPMNALPSDSWSCHLCLDIGTDTTHATGSKRKYSDGMTEWELKLCQKLLLNLFVHVDSLPFQHKVSKVQVPDYYKVITRPMDLNTVLTKLAPQHFEHYQSLEDFIIDIRQVFSNCFVYNSAESEVCKMGRRLEAFFDGFLRKFVPHENHYPDTEAKFKRARKEDSGVFLRDNSS